MRKLVLGCLGVMLLVGLVGGVAGYVYVIRPAREYLTALRQLASLGEMDRQVRNQEPFQPPASGELSPELVERFAAVRRSVEAALGGQIARLQERYQAFAAAADTSGQMGIADLLEASRDLAAVVGEAKRAQIAALNDAGLSLAEYEWVERQMYEAAGILVSSLDFKALQEAVANGAEGVKLKRREPGPVPDRNRELVKPYLDTLEAWLPLAWLGL